MKKIIYICLLVISTEKINAQIQVIPFGMNSEYNEKSMQEGFNKLKATTTIYLYNENDKNNLLEIDNIFKSCWTITPYKLVLEDSIDYYKEKKGYSFLKVQKIRSVGQSTISNYFNLSLLINSVDVKGKKIEIIFASVSMFPTLQNYKAVFFNSTGFYNSGSGFFKNYLQNINNDLQKLNLKYDAYTATFNKEKIGVLKTTQLFVPDYLFIKRKSDAYGNISEQEAYTEQELFGNYSYNYTIISGDNLNKKILENDTEFYYINYVQSALYKYITITNSKTGEIIYSHCAANSMKIKQEDIDELAAIIKKN